MVLDMKTKMIFSTLPKVSRRKDRRGRDFSSRTCHGMAAQERPCVANVRLEFKSDRDARIFADTLNVDEELQASSGKVLRRVDVDGASAALHLEACDERTLRLCLSGFMEMASVAVATFDEFSAI